MSRRPVEGASSHSPARVAAGPEDDVDHGAGALEPSGVSARCPGHVRTQLGPAPHQQSHVCRPKRDGNVLHTEICAQMYMASVLNNRPELETAPTPIIWQERQPAGTHPHRGASLQYGGCWYPTTRSSQTSSWRQPQRSNAA